MRSSNFKFKRIYEKIICNFSGCGSGDGDNGGGGCGGVNGSVSGSVGVEFGGSG